MKAYVSKHGVEPQIFSFSEDGIMLCSKVERPALGLRSAKKPYITKKIGLENYL